MLRRPTIETILVTLAVLAAAPIAAAQGHAYRGPHPMDLDGHWHLEDAVHVHDGLAVGAAPFGEVDGLRVFLADPLAYGWEADVWTFRGAHPLPGGIAGYCGIDGDHRHPFAPEGTFGRDDDGAYVFRGALRGGVDMVRPGRVAPPHPIVTADGPPPGVNTTPGIAPFWFAGCMHRLVMGPRGPIRVPLTGCTPSIGAGRGGHLRRHGRGRRDAAPAPAPAPARTYFDGRYTGQFETRPHEAPPRTRPRRQRR